MEWYFLKNYIIFTTSIFGDQILIHLKKIAGISVVLNTSFNGPGEPIVETPKEAIKFLLSSKLDVLYIEGKRITKAFY